MAKCPLCLTGGKTTNVCGLPPPIVIKRAKAEKNGDASSASMEAYIKKIIVEVTSNL
jgi:hypothetical protein